MDLVLHSPGVGAGAPTATTTSMATTSAVRSASYTESKKRFVTETKKPSFADRFAEAYQKGMRAEHEENAKAPKVYEAGEGGHDVVDADDKHMA